MPWRGPTRARSFPTLGDLQAAWVEQHLVVPGGARAGEPFTFSPDQLRHLLHAYRVAPDAPERDRIPSNKTGSEWFAYYGTQYVGPQKVGKDPFGAARIAVEALGPARYAGWARRGDAWSCAANGCLCGWEYTYRQGDPMGQRVTRPWIQILATADEQTKNTWRPLVVMLTEGPIANMPGLEVGVDEAKLPNGEGWIERVASKATTRLGAPLTFASFTEPHLFYESNGGREMARTVKRGLAGMGGLWQELTNAWDPSKKSEAQLTFESKTPGVYRDYRPPRASVDLDDRRALLAEIRYLYAEALQEAGGWVPEARILADVLDTAHDEADRRRYFLNEVRVGSRDFMDALLWAARARTGKQLEPLEPDDVVTLGFDGSRSRDCTALAIYRPRDGMLFPGGLWRPSDYPNKRVPRREVDQAVRNAFEAYDVRYMYADPFKWQDYLDVWAGAFPKRVVEFPTNEERRMDRALERFLTAIREDELHHSGDTDMATHVTSAALAAGKLKPARVDDDEPDDDAAGELRRHYLRLAKKPGVDVFIDYAVAAVLAVTAGGAAVEDGANEEALIPTAVWV